MERTMDLIAGELGLDPADVRLRNMIPHEEMPYRLGIPYRDGEADRLRQRRLSQGPATGAGRRSAASRRSGRGRKRRARRAAISASASAAMSRAPASARSRAPPCASTRPARSMSPPGACPQGQGMETIFSQVVADAWKVKPDDVVMALADTSAISIGFGTIASRSTVTLSSAIHYASEILREKAFAIAANMLECAPGDLELRSGAIGVVGVPGNEVTLASVAQGRAPGLGSRPPARHARPASRRPTTTSRRR